jgi:hypothetical protein
MIRLKKIHIYDYVLERPNNLYLSLIIVLSKINVNGMSIHDHFIVQDFSLLLGKLHHESRETCVDRTNKRKMTLLKKLGWPVGRCYLVLNDD